MLELRDDIRGAASHERGRQRGYVPKLQRQRRMAAVRFRIEGRLYSARAQKRRIPRLWPIGPELTPQEQNPW